MRQKQNIFYQGFLGLGVILLLWLRFFCLDNKPIHHDEAVNAWWLTQITAKGFFAYDPTNYHGPLFFYIQWIFERFLGADLWVLRGVSVLFSVMTVLLLWKKNYRWGALAMALSPAFFFFARSGIHESMFIFFQVLLVLGWIDLYEKKEGALSWILMGFVGSLAVKETWALSLVAMILATGVLGFRFLQTPFASKEIRKKTSLVIWLGVLFWAILYSGFFQKPTGILDFFKAFMPWLQTGTYGSGHDKSFWFWLELLFKFETLLALVFLVSSYFVFRFRKTHKVFSFIYVFFVFQFLIYSFIPYKTVWCLISLLWPLCLLVDEVFHQKAWRKTGLVLGAALALWQGVWIYRLNLQNPIEFNHPYVYVQSTQELKQFSDSIAARIQSEPGFADRPVLLTLSDSWPFPWIFRNNLQVRYVNTLMAEEEFQTMVDQAYLIVTDEEHLPSFDSVKETSSRHRFFLRPNDREIFILEKKK